MQVLSQFDQKTSSHSYKRMTKGVKKEREGKEIAPAKRLTGAFGHPNKSRPSGTALLAQPPQTHDESSGHIDDRHSQQHQGRIQKDNGKRHDDPQQHLEGNPANMEFLEGCLLYTSDAADE